MAVTVQGPRKLRLGHLEAFLWSVDLGDGVAQLAAWTPFDSHVRIAWAIDTETWSHFVALSRDYSPHRDLGAADTAVRQWAADHDRSQT